MYIRYPLSLRHVADLLYGAAMNVDGNADAQECGRWLNYRAETDTGSVCRLSIDCQVLTVILQSVNTWRRSNGAAKQGGAPSHAPSAAVEFHQGI